MATISVLTRGNAVRLASIVGRPGQAELADANRGRFALWLPVWFGIGIGIGLYFTLPVEPAFWPSIGGFALFGLAALFLHRARGGPFFALLIAATVTAGFAAAQFRTDFVSAPVLEREIGPAAITARVLKVEPIGKGVRLTLDRILVQRRDFATPPDRIRLSVRSTKTQPLPGDLVSALAILRPPPAPSLPGGFDFARKAWFERIDAVGFSLGAVKIVERWTGGGWRIWFARLRLDLTQRILAGAGDCIGPVAAALLTGERRAIPENTLAAVRDSGLAHLLAISGLHIGLVAGLLFFVVRLGLAMVEPVALRYLIKKIAAGSAILGAFAYLSISGATIPTQRAFLMVSIVMLAVMIDRTAISMRLVAIAAMAVLVLAPESLLSASFQMSFAAVVALVAVY